MPLFGKPNIEKMKQKRDLKGLYKSLKDKAVRHSAAKALGEIGDAQATELLIKALQDKKSKCADVAKTLGEIGDAKAVKPLIEALNDANALIMATNESIDRRTKALKPLIENLGDANALVIATAQSLGRIGDARAVKPLKKALLDILDPKLMVVICEALGEIGWVENRDEASVKYWLVKDKVNECFEIGHANVEPLVKTIKYTSGSMRKQLVKILIKIGDKRSAELLREELMDAMIDKRANNNSKSSLVYSLGEIGDAKAVEPLIEALNDTSFKIRNAATISLGRIGDARAVEPLIAALDKFSGWARAAKALGEIGDAKAVEPIVNSLLKPHVNSEGDYMICARSLIKIGDPRTFYLLEKVLLDEKSNPHSHVAFVLGEIGDPRAIEPLTRSLIRCQDLYAKTYVLRAIEKIRQRMKLASVLSKKRLKSGSLHLDMIMSSLFNKNGYLSRKISNRQKGSFDITKRKLVYELRPEDILDLVRVSKDVAEEYIDVLKLCV